MRCEPGAKRCEPGAKRYAPGAGAGLRGVNSEHLAAV